MVAVCCAAAPGSAAPVSAPARATGAALASGTPSSVFAFRGRLIGLDSSVPSACLRAVVGSDRGEGSSRAQEVPLPGFPIAPVQDRALRPIRPLRHRGAPRRRICAASRTSPLLAAGRGQSLGLGAAATRSSEARSGREIEPWLNRAAGRSRSAAALSSRARRRRAPDGRCPQPYFQDRRFPRGIGGSEWMPVSAQNGARMDAGGRAVRPRQRRMGQSSGPTAAISTPFSRRGASPLRARGTNAAGPGEPGSRTAATAVEAFYGAVASARRVLADGGLDTGRVAPYSSSGPPGGGR